MIVAGGKIQNTVNKTANLSYLTTFNYTC